MIDFSMMGRLFATLNNVRERLMKDVPPMTAQTVDWQSDNNTVNAFLVCIDIYPCEREVIFDSISVDKCRLLPCLDIDERCSPDWTVGLVEKLETEIVVKTKRYSRGPKAFLFYVKPQEPLRSTTVRVHSPFFLQSTSCRLVF